MVDYNPYTGELTIKARYDDWRTMVMREYKECLVQFIDSRPLSDKRRKTCYMLLKIIAKSTGEGLGRTKEAMKLKFLNEELQVGPENNFSLSDAPMSIACAFQRFLVDFILDWDIPCDVRLLDFVDDVGAYLYACLVNKKCCICGKPADLHHVDHVGAGRDREDIVHEGLEALPLCREHHTEAHTIGEITFEEKCHLNGGIILDKGLCRLYGLKTEEESANAEQVDWDGEIGP